MKDEARRALRESARKAWVNSEFYQHPTNDYPEHIVFADGYGAGYFDGLTAASRWRSVETPDDLPKEKGYYLWRARPDVQRPYPFDASHFNPEYVPDDFAAMYWTGNYSHYQKIEFTPEQGTEARQTTAEHIKEIESARKLTAEDYNTVIHNEDGQ